MAAYRYRIALIPGDGVGPEVITEAVKVLKTVAGLESNLNFAFDCFPWGCGYYLETGKVMPADGIEQLGAYDAILLGAVGSPAVPDHVSLRGLLLRIRQEFDQYINLRPIKLLPGVSCPLKSVGREDVDMIFVRENTEGEYSGAGARLYPGTQREVALQTATFSRFATERVIRYAFRLAERLGRSVTSISKANALNYSMVFWDEVFRQVAREFPEVPARSLLVDAAAMFFVWEPRRFEVVVGSNLFGDILTDLGAAIAGGMGLAAGANLNPEKKYPSMFEPIHGSAPDIAGKGIANPLAAVWSVSQMLDHFGRPDWGAKVLKAVETVLVEGKYRTPDIGGSSSTEEVGSAVCHRLMTISR
ncbi:MAG: tartrate dehydrogenase [Heliobacteriaceae bacterium]|nr:tartrate dehydrogenase [Heliobacteriaceae bacterium]MDD4587502.1 tartrate dehydrogenase [Heliobacteriaceae bacterium]